MGRPAPNDIPEQPEVEGDHLFFWDAFWELGADRQLGSVMGPIPSTSLRGYARDLGIVGDDFDYLRSVIRALDGAYLKLMAPPKGNGIEMTDIVSVNDASGIAAILRRNAKPKQPELKATDGNPD